MSSAKGNNITESFNSIRGDDDLCVSCGKHGCASKSNLCIVCQKAMGIKKISARRLAQLGWTAENQDMMCCGEQMEFYDDEKPYYFYCPVCEESIETGEFDAESFGAEESSKGLPWITFALIGLGAFVASRIKTVNFKAHDDCGCGCSGAGGCGDEKKADEGHYPNTYDPVQDFLPRYRYPEDSDWSNSYNPTDPYRPLDYQTVQTDTSVTADRM